MAHRESIQNQYLKFLLDGASFFWNVSDRVGYGYPSRAADVLLVQFLLNADLRSDKQRYSGVTEPYLEMDGKFGGKTWARIKQFQRQVADGTLSEEQFADGMVSPANGVVAYSPKKGILYTIYRLNSQYMAFYRLYYQDLSKDPMFPAALRPHLFGALPQLM